MKGPCRAAHFDANFAMESRESQMNHDQRAVIGSNTSDRTLDRRIGIDLFGVGALDLDECRLSRRDVRRFPGFEVAVGEQLDRLQ